jgi:hypothetical protein
VTVVDLDQKVQAAALLARGMSTDKVGEAVGRSGRTIRRWAEDPDFKENVRAARKVILAETNAALGAAARDAVETLHGALKDKSPAIRVRAALGILSALPTVAEHAELSERIAELEAAAQEAGAA